MRRAVAILVLGVLGVALVALVRLEPGVAIQVGAGLTARTVCSLHFHSGMDPERIMGDYVDHLLGPASALVRVDVDRASGVVDVTAAVVGRARAIRREGVGCTLLAGADEERLRRYRDPGRLPPLASDLPWPRGGAPPAAPPPAGLAAAVEEAFAEPEGRPGRLRQTTAVIVAHRGRLIAERYAPGVDASTPLLSWSMAKSVVAALVGVAVLEGRIDLAAPAPVPEWRGEADPRAAITTDMLLRMSSGLAFDEVYGAVNDVSRMLFTQADYGAFAAGFPLAHPPDTAWSYSSGTSNILARILRDLFAGDLPALVRWSRERLFDPVGMRTAVFEVDASGSFVGSSLVFASARDWARFGQLHLQGGVWEGRQILPEGWGARVSTPTPHAPEGRYGAGWWLNAGEPGSPEQRMWPDLPRETYAARGMSGQYVVVVPSAELVVVRLGLAQAEGDALHGIEPLVRAALDAVGHPADRTDESPVP
ncbi:MAG: serine hydrolase domain-containing protein [Myxococcota bacterium]